MTRGSCLRLRRARDGRIVQPQRHRRAAEQDALDWVVQTRHRSHPVVMHSPSRAVVSSPRCLCGAASRDANPPRTAWPDRPGRQPAHPRLSPVRKAARPSTAAGRHARRAQLADAGVAARLAELLATGLPDQRMVQEHRRRRLVQQPARAGSGGPSTRADPRPGPRDRPPAGGRPPRRRTDRSTARAGRAAAGRRTGSAGSCSRAPEPGIVEALRAGVDPEPEAAPGARLEPARPAAARIAGLLVEHVALRRAPGPSSSSRRRRRGPAWRSALERGLVVARPRRSGGRGDGPARSSSVAADVGRRGPSHSRSSSSAVSYAGRQRPRSWSSSRSSTRPPSARASPQTQTALATWPRCR